MAGLAANLKRQEAVTKRFQNELLAQTSWCSKKTSLPTEAELSILGDFQLMGAPAGGQAAQPVDMRLAAFASIEPAHHEWLSGILEREGTTVEARI